MIPLPSKPGIPLCCVPQQIHAGHQQNKSSDKFCRDLGLFIHRRSQLPTVISSSLPRDAH